MKHEVILPSNEIRCEITIYYFYQTLSMNLYSKNGPSYFTGLNQKAGLPNVRRRTSYGGEQTENIGE